MAPETCPNCGADVPANAKACPECGADETTGWSETAYASGLDLPDEDFDYEEFRQREFGKSPKPEGIAWHWWLTAIGLLILFLFFFLA